ncbi:hypothetical protein GAY29_08895 [Azospirillum brasilense]|uniref:hypothetical protein n=1 Tax=Azospirillum brasilense TaxID=192 RepID=UPI00190BBBD5|nr:hypothetical protein [Azospirillum brasilense]MBK3733227.1 hypothetical protein [Azospirillum brasilense]
MTATDPTGATARQTAAPNTGSPPAGGAGLPVPTAPAPDDPRDDPPPMERGWGGWTRGYGRRGSALRQKLAAHLAARRRKRRAWARDIARIVLVVSIMALAALAVEIGRKAVVVLNRADLGVVHLFGVRG